MSRTLINLSANLTGLTFPVLPVAFNQEILDTAGAFNPGVPGQIVVPSGMTMARLEASIRVPDSGNAGSMFVNIYKNGATAPYNGLDARRNSTSGYGNNQCLSVAPWQPVSPGDIFEVRCNVNGLGSPTSILADVSTWFAAEFA